MGALDELVSDALTLLESCLFDELQAWVKRDLGAHPGIEPRGPTEAVEFLSTAHRRGARGARYSGATGGYASGASYATHGSGRTDTGGLACIARTSNPPISASSRPETFHFGNRLRRFGKGHPLPWAKYCVQHIGPLPGRVSGRS